MGRIAPSAQWVPAGDLATSASLLAHGEHGSSTPTPSGIPHRYHDPPGCLEGRRWHCRRCENLTGLGSALSVPGVELPWGVMRPRLSGSLQGTWRPPPPCWPTANTAAPHLTLVRAQGGFSVKKWIIAVLTMTLVIMGCGDGTTDAPSEEVTPTLDSVTEKVEESEQEKCANTYASVYQFVGSLTGENARAAGSIQSMVSAIDIVASRATRGQLDQIRSSLQEASSAFGNIASFTTSLAYDGGDALLAGEDEALTLVESILTELSTIRRAADTLLAIADDIGVSQDTKESIGILHKVFDEDGYILVRNYSLTCGRKWRCHDADSKPLPVCLARES